MKTNYLFPYKLKAVSGILFLLSSLILFYSFFINEEILNNIGINATMFAVMDDTPLDGNPNTYFFLTENNIIDEILLSVFILSGLVFAFSKEKIEDEMTSKIRLESLVWSTYANYLLFFLSVWFIYGWIIYTVMIIALYTHLLFFIIRFNWKIYKFKHSADHEE